MRHRLTQAKRRMNSALDRRDPNDIVKEMFEGIETLIDIIDDLDGKIEKLNEKVNRLAKKSLES